MSSSIVDCIPQFEGIEKDQNVLQKHVAFFDINNDGIVYPCETYQGFRTIGSGIPLSFAAAIFINVGFSGSTRPGKCPSLLFPIEIKNIQMAKHGSDTGVYDSERRFVEKKFEEIFSKYALTNPDSLTWKELTTMRKANRKPKNYMGWFASYLEWKILFVLCKDKNGVLTRDTIRAVYDGSLFEKMAKEHASSKKKRRCTSSKMAKEHASSKNGALREHSII